MKTKKIYKLLKKYYYNSFLKTFSDMISNFKEQINFKKKVNIDICPK